MNITKLLIITQEVIDLKNDYSQAYANIGAIYHSKDIIEAIECYEAAVKLDPSSVDNPTV